MEGMEQEPTNSLAEQIGNWCRHYTGLINDRCEAGVFYENVRLSDRQGLNGYPCFKANGCADECPHASFLTEREVQNKVEHARQAIVKWATDLKSNICPHCGAKITKRLKVSRSIYADPCGHRLYQGRLNNLQP